MPTANLGYQSFYQAQLTAGISNTDLTIPLDVVPTPSEGFLVLESTIPAKREIIYYTSKTSNSVVCPAGGRGYDGTTASSHLQNAAVIMAPVAAMFSSMRDLFETTPQGWTPVTQSVSSVAYNGNRSYTLTMSADVSATLSPGMRVRTTRTVTAPIYMGDFFSGSKYFTKTSPTSSLSTVTNNITTKINIKYYAYPVARQYLCGRADSTPNNGFGIFVEPSGQIGYAIFNGGTGNARVVTTFQSIPLQKHTEIVVTHSGATILIYLDGVAVPTATTTTGTAPTTAGTGGDFSIGRFGAFTSAVISNAYLGLCGVFDAVLSAATIRSYSSQALVGTETNCIGAWSLNNTAVNQQAPGTNDLTATGGVGYLVNFAPFTNNSSNVPNGTTDFGIIQSVATTTVVVQVPEGNTIPTSGGVSAMSYSTQNAPYGFPVDKNRWTITNLYSSDRSTSSPVQNTWYNPNIQITVPIGSFNLYVNCQTYSDRSAAGVTDYVGTLSNVNNNSELEYFTRTVRADNSTLSQGLINITRNLTLSAATIYYYNHRTRTTSIVTLSTQALILELLPSGI